MWIGPRHCWPTSIRVISVDEPTRCLRAFRSRCVVHLYIVAPGQDALEVSPQSAQPVVADDQFAVRQNESKQLRMRSTYVTDGLSHGGEELVESFSRESTPCDDRLQPSQ